MRSFLTLLVAFVTVTALCSGLLLVADPEGGLLGLPPGLLQATPFHTYLFPGMLLAGLVGGCSLATVFLLVGHHPRAYSASLAAGWILVGWMLGQFLLVGAFHWLHLVYLLAGILIILISDQLKGKAAF
ncbi:hypothetical protein V9K67_15350 [Paraflavisolibacter sp. H34]|uniref:hypothetical protein n=1 Tax=Huijunlia imazamoxiresistens TaxID=3127457 RepID=UPI0030165AE3